MSNKIKHIYPLSTKNLCIGYSKGNTQIHIADNLELTARKGQFITLIGKNGSGKSTLLRTLAGFQAPLAGNVLINNRELSKYSANEIAQHIAVVFTEKIPDSMLRVHELISLGRQVYTNWLDQLTEKDKSVIKLAVELTDTKHLLNHFFDELSDGQKQKVLIARAIAQDTPILFLDEPTAHLDIHHRMDSFLLLKRLAVAYNKTIIIATHEISLATQLSDSIWLLDNKTIISGKPEALIKNKEISRVFNSGLIRFNPNTNTFEYKQDL